MDITPTTSSTKKLQKEHTAFPCTPTGTCPTCRGTGMNFVRSWEGLLKKPPLQRHMADCSFWFVAQPRFLVSLLFLLSHSLVDMVEFHLDLIKDWWSMMIFPLSSSLHQPDNKVEHKRCKKFLILGRFQTHSWLSVHWSSKHFMMLHVKDVVWNYCTTFN